MSNSCKEFSISENIKNISRFVDGEKFFTGFSIPWRMQVMKIDDHFALFLLCEKEEWNGWSKFISWKDLESNYVVDDSIVVEAHVKILNILDSPSTETEEQKIFLLNHTVHNISSIKEGGIYTTNIETHYNIPWRIEIERREGIFGVFLQCEKKHFDSKNWSIEVEYVLTLKSSNGQRFSFKETCTFNKPNGHGWDRFIRWDDMDRKYAVNGSIIIEARVKIIKLTGFEERPRVGRLSGIVIPVGDREYSMEE